MNALAESAPRSLALADDDLIPVLRSSLYPGAQDDSIKLVLGYCRAAGLDPMQKPVHLVPMRVKKVGGGQNDYEWRDVVMPGIGLYRVQASRTGELAGIDEPQFGPDVPMPGVPNATVPDFCRVTVYRIIGGHSRAFTAVEYWSENYATAGRDSIAPNAMWKRRPRGQIAKCAEAQALRKAFPELGSQPTADETIIDTAETFDASNGAQAAAPAAGMTVQRKAKPAPAQAPTHTVDADGVIDVESRQVTEPEKPVSAPAAAPAPAQAKAPAPAPAPTAKPAATGGDVIGVGEVAYLRKKADSIGVPIVDVLGSLGIETPVESLTREQFNQAKADLVARA